MRISDWSSDVCSSDLASAVAIGHGQEPDVLAAASGRPIHVAPVVDVVEGSAPVARPRLVHAESIALVFRALVGVAEVRARNRSEEHTSELQSLMRISYAVFCLKKKNKYKKTNIHI